MNRPGHENITYFIGTEVEHSPAFGTRTLFVVGCRGVTEILTQAFNNKCPHIYLGANQSFRPTTEWKNTINALVSEGIRCTLDFDVRYVEWVSDLAAIEYDNFIPMISVRLPNIKKLGYNATIKLDDKDFRATNPGVWCHSVHELMSKDQFTDWSKYTQDEVIK